MSAVGILMLGIGGWLLYSAVKSTSPNPVASAVSQLSGKPVVPSSSGGTTGVGASGAATAAPTATQAAIVTAAKAELNIPYEYGVFDCSKLTQDAYAALGINIGRDTSAQLKSGTVVGQDGNWAEDVALLQPGDLLFYGEPGATGPNAHVVLYIGNGQIIQASQPGTVSSIGNLFESASSDEPFVGVRRYLS